MQQCKEIINNSKNSMLKGLVVPKKLLDKDIKVQKEDIREHKLAN